MADRFNPISGFVPDSDQQFPTAFESKRVDASAAYPIGTELLCRDSQTGTIACLRYAQGVASVAAGDACILPLAKEAATRLVNSANGGLLGFAVANPGAGQFGWFQVGGRAVANVAAGFAAGQAVFATATAGVVDDAAAAPNKVLTGARSASAIGTPAASQAYVDCAKPSLVPSP